MRGIYQTPLQVPDRDSRGNYIINEYGEIILVRRPLQEPIQHIRNKWLSFRAWIRRLIHRMVMGTLLILGSALLGAVLGMIETFQAVSFKGAGLSQMVGSGISKALLTTQFGLIIALPGTFALSLLRRRYHQLVIKYHIKRIHKIMREKNVKSVS